MKKYFNKIKDLLDEKVYFCDYWLYQYGPIIGVILGILILFVILCFGISK